MQRSTISVVVMLFLASSPVAAQVDQHNSDHVRVRTEYKNSKDTQNHLVFWSILRSVRSRDAQDHDLTVQIIQRRFELDSTEEAEAIIANMLATADAITNEHLEIRNTILCKSERAQEKGVVYSRMDAVDDARAAATRRHYLSYISGLDETEEVELFQWLDERKKTYSYRTAEHEGLYEGTGIDMIAYIDQACAKWERIK